MGVVTIRCPRTAANVSVGLEITPEAFASLRPRIARMRCSACGSEHAWAKGIAWLEVDPRERQVVAPPLSISGKMTQKPIDPSRIALVREERDQTATVARLVGALIDGAIPKRAPTRPTIGLADEGAKRSPPRGVGKPGRG